MKGDGRDGSHSAVSDVSCVALLYLRSQAGRIIGDAYEGTITQLLKLHRRPHDAIEISPKMITALCPLTQ